MKTIKYTWYRLQWRFWRELHYVLTKYLGFRVSGYAAMHCLYNFCAAADKFLPLLPNQPPAHKEGYRSE